jgi:short-subunit dehydrogenase
VIVALNQDGLDNKAAKFRQMGMEVTTIAKDLSKMEEAKALCQEVNVPINVLDAPGQH